MEIKQLLLSEITDFYSKFLNSKQPLPFFQTHSKAQAAFINKLKQMTTTFVILNEAKPIAFFVFEKKKITNLLLVNIWQWQGIQILQLIEKIYKQQFLPYVKLAFPVVVPLGLQEILKQNGFQLKNGQYVEKKLSYKTALILGGGGAKGAYQIGVWQALKELNINVALICGTSVGALNGALMVQNDFDKAKQMWETIETQKILSIPIEANSNASLQTLIAQIRLLTKQAIQTNGVSTVPLQQLMDTIFSEDKMRSAKQELYIVTTQWPKMKEKVIFLNPLEKEQWKKWLLASASFFPAMQATKIQDHYYIDGGYRNNLPTDIAIKKEASEYIIVDVKGPGIVKHTVLPDFSSSWLLKSPWSIGNVLLFDSQRSTTNIQLGYLEMLKTIGKYQGVWYTVSDSKIKIRHFSRLFLLCIKKTYGIDYCKILQEQKDILIKLRNLYKDRVYIETLGLVLLELLAKQQGIDASKLYTIKELGQLMLEKAKKDEAPQEVSGQLSLAEWLKKYYDTYFFLSEQQQELLLEKFLTMMPTEKQRRVVFMLDLFPVQMLKIVMKEFIKQGDDK